MRTTEHGILMRAEMVLALLNSKVNSWPAEPIDPSEAFKWQTRRPVKFRPYNSEDGINLTATSLKLGHRFTSHPESGWCLYSMRSGCWNQVTEPIHCPYGKKGDALYVKETFLPKASGIIFRADFESVEAAGISGLYGGWKPSIFMPKKLCRIRLQLTEEPTIERVSAISEANAKAEGVTLNHSLDTYAKGEAHRFEFRTLYDSIHGKYPSAFLAGAWVWKLVFKRIL